MSQYRDGHSTGGVTSGALFTGGAIAGASAALVVGVAKLAWGVVKPLLSTIGVGG